MPCDIIAVDYKNGVYVTSDKLKPEFHRGRAQTAERRTNCMKYGKIALLVAACTMLTTVLSPVAALAEFDQPYISIGADLTSEQADKMIRILEVPEDKINEDTMISLTTDEESRYLGDAADPGSGAVTACKVVRLKRGSGIRVSTHNIMYVTSEMFENALVTCGLHDVDVMAASPVPVPGTAALVSTAAAWSKMNGHALDPQIINLAARELNVSSAIAMTTGNPEKTAQLVAAVKQIVLMNGTTDPEAILTAVLEVAEQIGLSLSEEEAEELAGIMTGLEELRLDARLVIDQVQGIFEKAKKSGLDLQAFGIAERGIARFLQSIYK